MFPFDIEDEDLEELDSGEENEEKEQPQSDYEIDFETGRLTGRIVTGIDAIKQWVKMTLCTDRYFYTQYSWDYGAELNTLVGQNYDQEFVESECRRMISDALSVNEDIEDIEDLTCELQDDRLTVSFHINTKYGGADINV